MFYLGCSSIGTASYHCNFLFLSNALNIIFLLIYLTIRALIGGQATKLETTLCSILGFSTSNAVAFGLLFFSHFYVFNLENIRELLIFLGIFTLCVMILLLLLIFAPNYIYNALCLLILLICFMVGYYVQNLEHLAHCCYASILSIIAAILTFCIALNSQLFYQKTSLTIPMFGLVGGIIMVCAAHLIFYWIWRKTLFDENTDMLVVSTYRLVLTTTYLVAVGATIALLVLLFIVLLQNKDPAVPSIWPVLFGSFWSILVAGCLLIWFLCLKKCIRGSAQDLNMPSANNKPKGHNEEDGTYGLEKDM